MVQTCWILRNVAKAGRKKDSEEKNVVKDIPIYTQQTTIILGLYSPLKDLKNKI